MRGDLHIHTTASDGCLSPRQIIMLAKNRGIDTIAISDHNSIDGLAEATEAGKKYGVSIIPAVELSTRFNNESIHILGYFRNEKFNSTNFKQILKLVKTHRVHKLRKVLGGYRKHQANTKYLSSSEGINLLRTYGAAVVLAHPVRISKKNLSSLLSMPFDGIEAKYCRCNDYYTNFFINVALKEFSFYTGGSDFHTDNVSDHKHSLIGEPYLDSSEMQKFLENSGALILGNSVNDKII
jgi:predicted metal-dependent phosphoesterase TrpH